MSGRGGRALVALLMAIVVIALVATSILPPA
jgi:hypothetical protein